MKTIIEKTGEGEFDIVSLFEDGLSFRLGRVVVPNGRPLVWFETALTLERVQEVVDLCRKAFDNSADFMV